MKQIIWFFRTYIILVVVFLIQKPIFLLVENGLSSSPIDNIWATMPSVMWHGLMLDLAVAGYMTLIPGLLLIASLWFRKELVRPVLNVYYALVAFGISLCFILNAVLYPFWKFPLDTTPFSYFSSSPADAFASTELWLPFVGLVIMVTYAYIIWIFLRKPSPSESYRRYSRYDRMGRYRMVERNRIRTSLILLVLTVLLIIPIRGGFGVSTNNTGNAYFSQNAFLNHAAVNPIFSLLESADHQNDFGSQYRFMADEEATKIFNTMVSTSDEHTYPLLNAETMKKGKPDILIVVMEGFASDMLPSIGSCKDVAINLDSIARQGVLFTRFYANSFRTDRGLVSILSGYPAQPNTSIMRYPAKAANLPSLVRSLAKERGYQSAYYYGGDVDFAFQRSYLVSQGFEKIVSDVDFPAKDRQSKWGVPDHILAERLLADIKAQKDKHPMLRVLQTSSSHEPFEVPYNRLSDKRLNSFAYTDSVLGNLIRQYSKLPQWKNTLVVMVPDHVGLYKDDLDYFQRNRYQIPLILAGGVVAKPLQVKLIGSQQDIAATLLGQLGISHKEFRFSKNMLSDATPKFAFFTVPDAFGVVSEENSIIFDNKSQHVVYDKGSKQGFNLKRGQAYLQKLFDDINDK